VNEAFIQKAKRQLQYDFSIPGERVAEVLNVLKEQGKCPKSIIVDNGTEFTLKAMDV